MRCQYHWGGYFSIVPPWLCHQFHLGLHTLFDGQWQDDIVVVGFEEVLCVGFGVLETEGGEVGILLFVVCSRSGGDDDWWLYIFITVDRDGSCSLYRSFSCLSCLLLPISWRKLAVKSFNEYCSADDDCWSPWKNVSFCSWAQSLDRAH